MITRKIINKLSFYIRCIKMKNKKVYINYSSFVDKNTIFEGYNIIHEKSLIMDCYIGRGTYIHHDSNIKKTKIGRYCSIAPGVKVVSGNHPTKNYVSTHPLFYLDRDYCGINFKPSALYKEYSYTDNSHKWYCEIGNDVWIGENALLLNGVKIGNGAIIASGSVVTKDVEPYAIVAGVPARIIRYRFDKETIDKINNSCWWDKDLSILKKNVDRFANSNSFMKSDLDE